MSPLKTSCSVSLLLMATAVSVCSGFIPFKQPATLVKEVTNKNFKQNINIDHTSYDQPMNGGIEARSGGHLSDSAEDFLKEISDIKIPFSGDQDELRGRDSDDDDDVEDHDGAEEVDDEDEPEGRLFEDGFYGGPDPYKKPAQEHQLGPVLFDNGQRAQQRPGHQRQGQYSDHKAGQYQNEGPGHFDNHRPGQYSDHKAGQYQNERPGHFDNDRPGQYSDHKAGQYQNERPGHFDNHRPGQYSDHKAGQYQNERPGHFDNHRPGQYSDHKAGQYQNERPGHFDNDRPGQYSDHKAGRYQTDKSPEQKRPNQDYDFESEYGHLYNTPDWFNYEVSEVIPGDKKQQKPNQKVVPFPPCFYGPRPIKTGAGKDKPKDSPGPDYFRRPAGYQDRQPPKSYAYKKITYRVPGAGGDPYSSIEREANAGAPSYEQMEREVADEIHEQELEGERLSSY